MKIKYMNYSVSTRQVQRKKDSQTRHTKFNDEKMQRVIVQLRCIHNFDKAKSSYQNIFAEPSYLITYFKLFLGKIK